MEVLDAGRMVQQEIVMAVALREVLEQLVEMAQQEVWTRMQWMRMASMQLVQAKNPPRMAVHTRKS